MRAADAYAAWAGEVTGSVIGPSIDFGNSEAAPPRAQGPALNHDIGLLRHVSCLLDLTVMP